MVWTPGTKRECVPLPSNATNEDLQWDFVYDTGKRKFGDFFDIVGYQRYLNAEQKQVRALMPGGMKRLPEAWNAGCDAWLRQSAGAIVFQTWDLTDEARQADEDRWQRELAGANHA